MLIMREIIKYKVADKEFANKQDALEYEEKLRNNLYERALHLVAYFWGSYGYPAHPEAINLINHFCENRKIPTEMGGELQIGELLLVGTGVVEKWLKNNPMETLTRREQLILDANKSFRRVFRYDSGKKLSIDLIHWEVDEMKNTKAC